MDIYDRSFVSDRKLLPLVLKLQYLCLQQILSVAHFVKPGEMKASNMHDYDVLQLVAFCPVPTQLFRDRTVSQLDPERPECVPLVHHSEFALLWHSAYNH